MKYLLYSTRQIGFWGVTAFLLAESQEIGEQKWFTAQNVALKTMMTLQSVLNAKNLWLVIQLLGVNGDEKKANASGYPTADQSQA
jgi:hypothetical protein